MAQESRTEQGLVRRIGVAGAVAAVLVGVAVSLPTGGGGVTSLAAAVEQQKSAQGIPHDDALLAPHNHNDPATKNDVSRGLAVGEEAVDPTTAAERTAAEAYVDEQRALPDPNLVHVAAYPARTAVPADRYAMAGGCYALTGAGKAFGPYYFKATRLGGYLLHTPQGELAVQGTGVGVAAKPSAAADWTATKVVGGFRFDVGLGKALTVVAGKLTKGAGTTFSLRTATGCPSYPEADINVTGDPFAGETTYQEVRGFVDAHTHGMAFEFLGGKVHCGRPWHAYGAPYALVDCPDHTFTQGKGALLESVLSGEASHDPVGWPTFKDWPAPESLTHEGTYYRWLERAWRGGQRVFVNLLVENNKLCQLYPLKRNSCDDMTSIRLQAKDMRIMQDYIDAQFGGPGKGFYRIVKDPFEARRVINSGKMAVVMGIETSIPFGCTYKKLLGKDFPACTTAEIDANLDEMRALGVRQMELVNKFDNALAGVAGDAGAIGPLVNTANFLETGSFWAMEHCEPADGESADNPQIAVLPDLDADQQDALFGAVGKILGLLPATPLYGPPAHCNKRGLTELGVHTIKGMAQRNMIFDPDHLSVKARAASMDVIEDLAYPGVISSHSWSTPDTYPRIYKAGGFITPYAGDSTGFVAKWRRHLGWADSRYYFGFGFGADINGLGAQGNPRGADVANPVTYPFTGLGGVTIDKQQAGQRTWDINVDGVAQYGLYPDWVEDLRRIADAQNAGDGEKIVDDMARGAEAYLQMWERSYGVRADSCRNADLRKSVSEVQGLVRTGMTTEAVLRAVGQPFERLGTTYSFCARTATRAKVPVRVSFTSAGKVSGLAFS
ncbi:MULTISPECIES: hypothetical protein [unclassified Nocardioides]|uniref:hypothetical protein n=1 Tax=unclassified Nocardioides TaxID=2615069 RepID=UPI00070352D9|nr:MULTISPECIES: hypothetical protein [unclassified Nocardioides]KRC52899.1 hypothetical protein ASE19_10860 [Nocardioides sp. Root79]KRC72429.1 hypothetical protein ASE20_07395 [Nocardioides sp. Root240]